MPDAVIDMASLDAALKDNWIILTPNHRSAVQVHENYGSYLKRHGFNPVCTSPKIYPVDIWLRQLVQELIIDEDQFPALTVLESNQELALWKKIIREHDLSSPLIRLENAASGVREAYRLILQWQITLASVRTYHASIESTDETDDCSAFLSWCSAYQKYCKQEKIISFSELLQKLLNYLKSSNIQLSEKIILLGFTNPPPLYKSLFEVLQNKIDLKFMQWHENHPAVSIQSHNDEIAELRKAASWSKLVLKNNPAAKIGIISNSITEHYNLIHSIFQETFKATSKDKAPYNIASGKGFSLDFPLLSELAELLTFNQEQLSCKDLCHLLRSPLLIAQEEEMNRANLEFHLRDTAQSQVRSAELRYKLTQADQSWHSPMLAQALEQCENLRRQQKYSQTPEAWADFFTSQLLLLVGSDADSDQQFSLLFHCWYQILETFKKLGFLIQSITLNQALQELRQIIHDFNYNEHRQEAPIQIYSPYEAADLRFTHIWFMGLSDLQWPAHQHANPFIPLGLQKKSDLPNSSPAAIHKQAVDNLQALRTNTSEQLILSLPRSNESGELYPSPLMAAVFSEATIETIHTDADSLQLHPASLELYSQSQKTNFIEILEESSTVELLSNEPLLGGTSLIRNQSACPFKAFAINRLQATELPAFTYGIPVRDIGNMIHKVLEYFWGQLTSQSELKQISKPELMQLIDRACEVGISFLAKRHKLLLSPVYARLEKQRLIKLMNKWLSQEHLRSSFEVVAREHDLQWQYTDLTLNFKIDRIDKINQGYALIDYKTGIGKSAIPADQRPEDPQLLLYASALTQAAEFRPLNALLYARVNIESASYQGLSLESETFPGTGLQQNKNLAENYSWEDLLQYWQTILSSIAQEFLDGYVAVKPQSALSCQHCHLDAFCRIKTLQNQTGSSLYD